MDATFPAVVLNVVDGDSILMDVNLQWHKLWAREQEIRVRGCNAREHSQAGGPEATASLAALLPAGAAVTLHGVKADKFGERTDAFITLPDGRDLTQLLIQEQWAAPWDGKGVKPVPPWPRTIGA